MSGPDAEDRLEQLLEAAAREGFDVRVRLDIASECAWSCELAWTPEPNRADRRPDRSLVVYAAGGTRALDALERCLDELDVWRGERGRP
jgi:hypothetical protein